MNTGGRLKNVVVRFLYFPLRYMFNSGTKEELQTFVQNGVAKRLNVDASRITVEVVPVPTPMAPHAVALNILLDGKDTTAEQTAIVASFLRKTVDAGAQIATSC